MHPPARLAPVSRRRVILVAATTAALATAAACYLVATMRRPFAASLDGVAVEEAVARERARTCRPPPVLDGRSPNPILESRTALASARGLPAAAALRAELAVLRTAVESPRCATLLELVYVSAMMKMADEAIRATWTAPELTAADRAAAAAELATIDAAEPAIERIIEAETDWALVRLAPALRGEPAHPSWQYRKQDAAALVRDVLRTRARLRAACPAGTALAACADALADRTDLGSYTLILRRYVAGLARLDALRADLR